ncbi:MAG TPA: T9SS type A sorting domain-containing protein, partial [Rhodothermales bacterium]
SDVLNQREDARRALASFHEARRRGIESAAKTAKVYQIGETRDFLVHTTDLEGQNREPKTFELKNTSAVANVWVEVGELNNGNVTDPVLESLSAALLTATPTGSYNPAQGIIANNNQVFGDPPNVDRDPNPIVDVLLYNIPDQNQGSVLAGFVWSGDLCTTANASTRGCNVGFSNQADVLYLDTNPLLDQSQYPVETLLEVAAHEYQHLIHFAYDEAEESFVNEGLSEWAERLNGYRARNISYLSTETERNISLFSWRNESADVLKDYQRASLFTTYLAERLGPALAGNITKRGETGSTGYRAIIEAQGMTLEDLIVDFHTANLLNDLSVGGSGHFGYSNPYLQNLQASVSPARLVDGRTTTVSPPSSFTVNGGGSIYLKWENVSDFSLTLNLANATPLDFGRARARAVLESGGNVSIQEVTVGGTPTTFQGAFDAITIVATHVKPVSSGAIGVSVDKITYEYSAAWGGGQQVESELVQYDNGLVNGTFGFYVLDSDGNGVVANRFNVPNDEAVLGRVYVSPYFLSQFSNGNQPPEAPRDIDLRVWADDGTGRPGELLYSTAVTDGRDYPEVLTGDYEIRFHAVDLSKVSLPELPAVIHVGYAETGTDENFMVMGFVNYTTENVSFVGEISGDVVTWGALWDRQIRNREGEVTGNFSGKALPIRAEFLTGLVVDTEEEVELPDRIALEQNYPNPFNPATSIAFTLPRAQQVRLAVYDLTGRLVRSLVDGTMASGEHLAHFDGSGIASGVYVYVLETEDVRLAKKMMLVK